MRKSDVQKCDAWYSPVRTRIGAGAFEYDFGALENTDNKLTKSYKHLLYASFPFDTRAIVMIFSTAPMYSATVLGDIYS